MNEKEQILSTGFCQACADDSTAQSPGNISTINGIGRKFYGQAEKCAACGSVVRVLWLVFAYVPILPLGSYRFQMTGGGGWSSRSRFLARKTRLRWPQVFAHWGVGLALGAVGAALLAAYVASKQKR